MRIAAEPKDPHCCCCTRIPVRYGAMCSLNMARRREDKCQVTDAWGSTSDRYLVPITSRLSSPAVHSIAVSITPNPRLPYEMDELTRARSSL